VGGEEGDGDDKEEEEQPARKMSSSSSSSEQAEGKSSAPKSKLTAEEIEAHAASVREAFDVLRRRETSDKLADLVVGNPARLAQFVTEVNPSLTEDDARHVQTLLVGEYSRRWREERSGAPKPAVDTSSSSSSSSSTSSDSSSDSEDDSKSGSDSSSSDSEEATIAPNSAKQPPRANSDSLSSSGSESDTSSSDSESDEAPASNAFAAARATPHSLSKKTLDRFSPGSASTTPAQGPSTGKMVQYANVFQNSGTKKHA
jgi:hypothetical protein